MSDLLARVSAALEAIPHGAACDYGYRRHCTCDREQRIAQRVAAAIVVARQVYQSATFANRAAWMEYENAPQQNAEQESNDAALRALSAPQEGSP